MRDAKSKASENDERKGGMMEREHAFRDRCHTHQHAQQRTCLSLQQECLLGTLVVVGCSRSISGPSPPRLKGR